MKDPADLIGLLPDMNDRDLRCHIASYEKILWLSEESYLGASTTYAVRSKTHGHRDRMGVCDACFRVERSLTSLCATVHQLEDVLAAMKTEKIKRAL